MLVKKLFHLEHTHFQKMHNVAPTKPSRMPDDDIGSAREDTGLQTMISDQMKKIIQNMLKAPTTQNQHICVQGG